MRSKKALPYRNELLIDSDKTVELDLIRTLLLSNGQKTITSSMVPHLIDLIKDSNQNIRVRSIDALGQLCDTKALPYLIEAIRDNDKSVMLSAIEALGQLGDAKAAPYLLSSCLIMMIGISIHLQLKHLV